MNQQNALLIFVKNPVAGKVKTRLAAAIGDAASLSVYKKLLHHAQSVTQEINTAKIVYYSDSIQPNDLWNSGYIKALQKGADLGERMMMAFKESFEKGYKKAVIIGTDCPALKAGIIEEAFEKLSDYDIVIGPAYDGGYYLLGMKKVYSSLFKNIPWSTATVLEDTIAVCKQNNLTYYALPVLHDIDEESDLVHLNKNLLQEPKLIFVYNANSDLFSTVTDFAHKILSPATYKCRLCALTYDNFSTKYEWKKFIEGFPLKTIFLYKEEWEQQYQIKADPPAVYLSTDVITKEAISRKEMEKCTSLTELKELIIEKLNDYVQHHHTHL